MTRHTGRDLKITVTDPDTGEVFEVGVDYGNGLDRSATRVFRRKGSDVLIIDDPEDPEAADTPEQREAVRLFFETTIKPLAEDTP